jgi:hypothetical protein
MSCHGVTLCWRQQSRLTGSLEGLAVSCGMPDGRALVGSRNRLRRQDAAARGLGLTGKVVRTLQLPKARAGSADRESWREVRTLQLPKAQAGSADRRDCGPRWDCDGNWNRVRELRWQLEP